MRRKFNRSRRNNQRLGMSAVVISSGSRPSFVQILELDNVSSKALNKVINILFYVTGAISIPLSIYFALPENPVLGFLGILWLVSFWLFVHFSSIKLIQLLSSKL